MRWRLFIEEYSPDLQYIKGENNVVADALSRLPKPPHHMRIPKNHSMLLLNVMNTKTRMQISMTSTLYLMNTWN